MKIENLFNTEKLFLTDSGFETTIIFHHNIDLPHFALFSIIDKARYRDVIYNYYREHLDLAIEHNTGFILESATWRANKDWGFKLGYNQKELIKINTLAIEQLKAIKKEYVSKVNPILISGQIGPAGDGYVLANTMTPVEAKQCHSLQILAFKEAGADLASALTIGYINEALGIVQAAKEHQLPVVISFTVETNGKLPSGESLKQAIETIDKLTNEYPLYYMINCAHPLHFINEIETLDDWKLRIKGVRANASCKSHAELDEATELDSGDPTDFGKWHIKLLEKLPHLKVFGGCCGTDVSHIIEICKGLNSKIIS
jgi:S-methylmethionine-dependent homocysteine/selenocysteine methylase